MKESEMSTFQQLSARSTLNVTDITKALKAGEITVEEAATLLDNVKLRSPLAERQKDTQLKGQLSILDDAWLLQTPENSYEGLKSELSDREYIEMYYKIMELRGFS